MTRLVAKIAAIAASGTWCLSCSAIAAGGRLQQMSRALRRAADSLADQHPCIPHVSASAIGEIHPLTKYRLHEGISKAALAARLGVSRAAITRYEAGDRGIDRDLVGRFAVITGIPEAALAGYQNWRPIKLKSSACADVSSRLASTFADGSSK